MLLRTCSVLSLGALSLILGCDAGRSIELVDLNKVLDILVKVLDEGGAPNAAAPSADGAASQTATANSEVSSDSEMKSEMKIVPTDPAKQDPEAEKKFCKAFAEKLNAAKLIATPIGISMDEKGDILGFSDANGDSAQGADEAKLFTIQIDAEGQRLIASDEQGNQRPHHYRPHYGMHGFLLGSMLGRQSSYYSGDRAAMRPDFKAKTMSPSNYHSAAVTKARASSSSFRSSSSSTRARSGSGGFSFGK